MFKRKSIIVFIICIMLPSIILVASASSGQPGSDSDPLVTKSYVDQKFAQLSAQIGTGTGTGTGTVDDAALAQLQVDVGDMFKFITDALVEIEELKGKVESLENGYIVVEAKAGQTIVLSGGSEAILRSGTAQAIGGTYGGIADVTAGVDLKQGDSTPAQHLLISSRSDGRGIKITKDAFLIIRGAYTIK